MIMKIKAAWKYAIILVGITLTAIAAVSLPLFRAEPDCFASQGQTVVKWKDQYWPCKHWWSIRCRRKHGTYKVTVNEGIPVHNENGMPIPMAGGKIRNWTVYDSTTWNGLEDFSAKKIRYPDYEPIADNEYIVVVETRYRLFHQVEATLRICTQTP